MVTRKQAQDLAYALGINLYLRADGSLAQQPPGELVPAGPNATPQLASQGRFSRDSNLAAGAH